MDSNDDVKRLTLENKKLAREVKRLNQDIALLREANTQAVNTQEYIQRETDRQIFYIAQLMRTSPNVFILTDHLLRTAVTSDLFFRYNVGYDKNAIRRGVPLRDALGGMLSETELDEFMGKCRAALAGEQVKSYLLHKTYADGRKSWRITIRRMSGDEEAAGLNILFADTTEIVDALERAEAADKAKSSFLANMSHEIRTPINAMLGLNEMILRESSERETLDYAADVRNAGRTLLSLVNDILDFSKVEEGKMEILPAQYDLSSLIGDLVNMIRTRAEDKGLRLEVRVQKEIPQVLFGDEIRIRQCALNLLTNAVKYTQKGTVTLAVGYEEAGENMIRLAFRVSDTGIGMKRSDLEKLFAPFTRIEESRNRSIEGTGLGMVITQKLLALMGSRLEVESVYGEGSTFSFSLEQPVVKWTPIGVFNAAPEMPDTRRAAYQEAFHAPDARILVVDDMPVNLTVIQGLLKKTMVAVETATSGAEAVEKASRQKYDVIFIDHMMPGMDGIETLGELQKLPDSEKTAYIALTANAISGSRELYLDAGFSDYLSKPVDSRKLEEMLMAHLPPEKLQTREAPAAVVTDAPVVFAITGDETLGGLIESVLGASFRVELCRDGAEAPGCAEELRPDLILLDVRLGGTSGFEVLRALRSRAATHSIPIVLMTDEENVETEELGFRNGASDLIRKAYLKDALPRRARRIIALDRMQTDLQNEVKRQISRTEQLGWEMMLSLAKSVDAKDRFTSDHSERVAAYAAEIARRMGKSSRKQEMIYRMGLLHDIGKIGVSEETLNQPELTGGDFSQIKRHTLIGSDILRTITEMPELAQGARSHHERYDGTGYPDGLKGADIPEAARILCVADCYDAMTSTRAYSPRRTQAEARAEIEKCSGTQFDPEIAKVMLQMIDEDTAYVMNERTADISVWKGHGRKRAEAAAAAPETEEHTPPETLPDWLYRTEELDVAQGLRFCGDEESYLDTLKIYAQTAAGYADEIEACWRAADIRNTAVKVHALKSTSRAIGAEALGALAEKLELAGKSGDEKTLNEELGGLLARYRALGGRLMELVGRAAEPDTKPPLAERQLREHYETLARLLREFEYDRAADLIGFLDGYRLPEGERERFGALKRAAEGFEWERLAGLLEDAGV